MSAQIDCPICMDVIEYNTNCVTTECGHCFHASCLMTNVAHNGFECPYCRTVMAEIPEEDSDDEYDSDEENTVFDEDVLTSFRMFHQRINGEEVEEESEDDSWETDDEEENEQEEIPDAAYVAAKLIERGITFEDLVKNILYLDHSHFNDSYADYERHSSEIYGQFRIIITQYNPSQSAVLETKEEKKVVDSEAQPKISIAPLVRNVSFC